MAFPLSNVSESHSIIGHFLTFYVYFAETETKNVLPFAAYLRKRMPPFMTVWLVLLGSIFLTFFVGMEQMHLQLLPAFVVNTDLHLSPSEAALISSAAAAAFTIG